MKKVLGVYRFWRWMAGEMKDDHIAAHAAQAAFFFVICLLPCLLLLITLVQYTPVTKEDVLNAVLQVFPSLASSLLTMIVNQVYNQSLSVIPITVVVALWSAGKGVMAISNGMNSVYKCDETRNYVFLRIRASVYTVLFLVVIILLLVLSVFGNTLYFFVVEHIPLGKAVAEWLIKARVIINPIVLFFFSMMSYRYLPNQKERWRVLFPGALFTVAGWLAVSLVFSVYLDIFKGFSSMYGSLTTIILIMLWLYFCMYIILMGGEINVFLQERAIMGRHS